ncbi:MAG: TonB-dependent receptor [Planctomycetes bacterium]|jgi:iron complex outermembrane receptor protein|nr:TonB-dependent receptor [Planctomycetota bacterium]
MRLSHAIPAAVLLATAVPGQNAPSAPPQEPASNPDVDLTELSLEQLMEVPVEVSSRQSQSLARTAAAVFVLNEPEIRRSGLRSVPELLRLVPGLIIAQDVPGAYGFSSRLGEYGFSGMLVLIDGQRLYNTLLRREYWQAIDLPVEIIERIEVVRGPGGARWGDKATQGVINIVTRRAKNVAGARISGVVGTEERLIGSFRWGDSLGDATDFYLWGKLAQRDGGAPNTSGDRWDNNAIGMRVDTELDAGVALTVDGMYHDSFLGDSYEVDPGFSSLNMIKGGHLKSRLRVDHDEHSWTEWRVGVDGYDQDIRDFRDNVPDFTLRFREELFDTMLQHSRRLGSDLQLTVGTVLRHLTVESFRVFSGRAAEYNETRGDVFAALDWDLDPHLRLTLGGNLGYQDGDTGSGVDSQPDLRLAWTPSSDFTLWTAFSANREPDRKVEDSGLLVRRPSPNLLAYELGLRKRFGESVFLQLDGFAYHVDRQTSGFDTDPGTGATLYLSDGRTNAFGGEASIAWNPIDNVRVTAFLATTEANSRNQDPAEFFTIEEQVPRLRGGMTVGWEPVPGLELDSNLLYTQRRAGIPTWWRLDLRLGWRANEATSIDLVGQNLTDPRHQEYYYQEQAERGVYLMVTHRF